MSKLTLPVKRGTFIEFRTGLINVCPVGRSCSQEEREQFEVYDREHGIRVKFVDALKKEFPTLGLEYCIGKLFFVHIAPFVDFRDIFTKQRINSVILAIKKYSYDFSKKRSVIEISRLL